MVHGGLDAGGIAFFEEQTDERQGLEMAGARFIPAALPDGRYHVFEDFRHKVGRGAYNPVPAQAE